MRYHENKQKVDKIEEEFEAMDADNLVDSFLSAWNI